MLKEQKRNIIIILIVLILVAGFIFYVQKDSKNGNKNTETPLIDENNVNVNIEGEPLDDARGNSGELEEEYEEDESKISQDKEKFSLIMDNARKAFREGKYNESIEYYNKALPYAGAKEDVVYSGFFIVYSAQNDTNKAEIAVNKAIELNPRYTEYWIWKLALLDERTNTSFQDLKSVYNEGLLKSDPKTKVNLVTFFAGLAERNNEKQEAVAVWEYAEEIFPSNSSIYQAEIDRLEGR